MSSPEIEKKIVIDITGNPDELNNVIDTVKKNAGKSKIDMQFNIDTAQIEQALKDVKQYAQQIGKAFSHKSVQGFDSIEKSLVDLQNAAKETQNVISKMQFVKDKNGKPAGQLVYMKGFSDLARQVAVVAENFQKIELDEGKTITPLQRLADILHNIETELSGISMGLNIKPSNILESEFNNANESLERLKKNMKAVRSSKSISSDYFTGEKELGIKQANRIINNYSQASASGINTYVDNLYSYIKAGNELNDVLSCSIDVLSKNDGGIVTNKTTLNMIAQLKEYKDISAQIQDLQSKKAMAVAKEKNFSIGLDADTIKEFKDALQNANFSMTEESVKSLTETFQKLQTTVEEISATLKNFNIPVKNIIPAGEGYDKPIEEIREVGERADEAAGKVRKLKNELQQGDSASLPKSVQAFNAWHSEMQDFQFSDNMSPWIPMDGGQAEKGAYNNVKRELSSLADEVLRLQEEYDKFDVNRPIRELEKLEEELRDAEIKFAGTYSAANQFFNEALDKPGKQGGASKKVQDLFGYIMGGNSFDENGAWGRNSKLLENRAISLEEHIQQIFQSLDTNQISSTNLFTWIEQNGTSAEKETLRITEGLEEFRKVLRGLSTTSNGMFDFSETLGLDNVTLKIESLEQPIIQSQKRIQQEVQRTAQEIKDAYTRMQATKERDVWSAASIQRTLSDSFPGVNDTWQSALSQLKQTHEYYEQSVSSNMKWEEQYQWAIKFVRLFEEYKEKKGVPSTLAQHEELYMRLKPLVSGYREELQKVLDYGNQKPIPSGITESEDEVQKETSETGNIVQQVYSEWQKEVDKTSQKYDGLEEKIKELIPLMRSFNDLSTNHQSNMYDYYKNDADIDDEEFNNRYNQFAKSLPKTNKGIKEYIESIVQNGDVYQKQLLGQMAQYLGEFDGEDESRFYSIGQNAFNELKSKASKEKMLSFSKIINEYIKDWKSSFDQLEEAKHNMRNLIKDLSKDVGLGSNDVDVYNVVERISHHEIGRIKTGEETAWLKQALQPNEYKRQQYFDALDISEIDSVDKISSKITELNKRYEELRISVQQAHDEFMKDDSTSEDLYRYRSLEDELKQLVVTMNAYDELLNRTKKASGQQKQNSISLDSVDSLDELNEYIKSIDIAKSSVEDLQSIIAKSHSIDAYWDMDPEQAGAIADRFRQLGYTLTEDGEGFVQLSEKINRADISLSELLQEYMTFSRTDGAEQGTKLLSDSILRLVDSEGKLDTDNLQRFYELLNKIKTEGYSDDIQKSIMDLSHTVPDTDVSRSAGETAEKVDKATEAIREGGSVIENVTQLKKEFAEANKKVAASAEETADATKKAAEGIKGEGNATLANSEKPFLDPVVDKDEWDAVTQSAYKYKKELVDIISITRQNRDGNISYKVQGAYGQSITLGRSSESDPNNPDSYGHIYARQELENNGRIIAEYNKQNTAAVRQQIALYDELKDNLMKINELQIKNDALIRNNDINDLKNGNLSATEIDSIRNNEEKISDLRMRNAEIKMELTAADAEDLAILKEVKDLEYELANIRNKASETRMANNYDSAIKENEARIKAAEKEKNQEAAKSASFETQVQRQQNKLEELRESILNNDQATQRFNDDLEELGNKLRNISNNDELTFVKDKFSVLEKSVKDFQQELQRAEREQSRLNESIAKQNSKQQQAARDARQKELQSTFDQAVLDSYEKEEDVLKRIQNLRLENEKLNTSDVRKRSNEEKINELLKEQADLQEDRKNHNLESIEQEEKLLKLQEKYNEALKEARRKGSDTGIVKDANEAYQKIKDDLLEIRKLEQENVLYDTGEKKEVDNTRAENVARIADLKNEILLTQQQINGLDAVDAQKQREINDILGENTRLRNEALQNSEMRVRGGIDNNLQGNLSKLIDLYNGKFTGDYKQRLLELINQISELQAKSKDLDLSKLREEADKLQTSINNVLSGKGLSSNKAAAISSLNKLKLTIEEIMSKNSRMGAQFRKEFSNLELKINDAQSIADVEKLKGEIVALETKLNQANKTGKSFFDMIRTRTQSMSANFLARYFSLYDIIRYTRTAVNTIKELDEALVDLKKTTTMSATELEDFYANSSNVAKSVGTTTKEIISQAAAWSRLNNIGLLYGNV